MLSISYLFCIVFIISSYRHQVSCRSTVPILNSTKFYTVSSVLMEPFLMLKEQGWEGAEPEYEGFVPDLLHEVSENIGIHFKLSLAKDGKIGGTKLKDGSWDGMMGDLIARKIDLGVGPFTVTSIRGRVIDFSKPFMHTGVTVVIDDPPDDGIGGFSAGQKAVLIFSPFSVYAWLIIILCCLLLLAFAVLVRRFLPNPDEKQQSIFSVITSMRIGGPWSTCLFRFTCACFVLLVLVLYTAGAVTVLLHTTRLKYHAPPVPKTRTLENQDLENLLSSGLYTIAVVKDGSSSSFLRHSPIPIYHRVYEKLHFVNNISDGFKLVHQKPNTAFVTESALADYYMNRKPYCNLEKFPNLNAQGYAFALPLNSNLYDIINIAILHLHESGTIAMLHKRWWSDRSQCEPPILPAQALKLNKENVSVKVDGPSVGGVLIVLTIGILLTLGTVFLERRLASSKVNVGRANLRDLDDHLLHTGGARGMSEVPLA